MSSEIASSGSPTPEEVLSAVDRTGFIFEHRVARKLYEHEFAVDMNDVFRLPDWRFWEWMQVPASS
jgi:hypothetical protein